MQNSIDQNPGLILKGLMMGMGKREDHGGANSIGSKGRFFLAESFIWKLKK